jgi:hypothetical protein
VHENHQIGDAVRITCSFRALATGALTDPTTITVKTRVHKSGSISTFVFGTDAEVVKDSTGVFHFDFAFAEAGAHFWRFAGTGTVKAATEGTFEVLRSNFEAA